MNLTQPSYYDMALLHTYFLIAIDEDAYQEITALYNQMEIAYKKRIQEWEKVINSSFITGLPIDLKWKTLKTMAVLERPAPDVYCKIKVQTSVKVLIVNHQ